MHGLTFNVLKLLMEAALGEDGQAHSVSPGGHTESICASHVDEQADPQLFDECSAKHREDEEEEGRREQETFFLS